MARLTYLPSNLVSDSGSITATTSAPSAPAILNIDVGQTSANVTVGLPTTFGGGFMSNYTLSILNSSSVVVQSITDISPSTSIVPVGQSGNPLTPGTTYTALLTASNDQKGAGAAATQTFQTFASGTGAWDPSLQDWDLIVGPTSSESSMTFIAKGDSFLNGAVVPAGTPGATVLNTQPNVGPGYPLYTSRDGSGNAILNQVKLDGSLNYLQANGGTQAAPGLQVTNSILQTAVLGNWSSSAPNTHVSLNHVLLEPTIGAAQAAGGGALMHGNILALYTDIGAPTDVLDPSSHVTTLYTRFSEQKPGPIDGKPFNGFPPAFYNSNGSRVNGYYSNNNVVGSTPSPIHTNVSATTTSNNITDAQIVYGDLGSLVVGTGIPAGSYVGLIAGMAAGKHAATTKGTGFALIDCNGNAVNPTSTISGGTITLQQTPLTKTVSVSIAQGATTVIDSSIMWYEGGKQLTDPAGVGLPPNGAYVGHVVPGASYTIVDSFGDPMPTQAAMTQITRGAYESPSASPDYPLYKDSYSNIAGGQAGILGNITNFTGTLSTTSMTITSVSSVTNLQVGNTITGTGIPSNTSITAVGTNTITISAFPTVSGSQTISSYLPGLLQIRMYDYGSKTTNGFLLQCVVAGKVDAAGTITGATSTGYSIYPTNVSQYFTLGGSIPQGVGPFFTVINGTATNVPFSANSDGTVNLTALAATAATINPGGAVWVNLGGFPHSDGIQMLNGQGLFVDHCGFFSLDTDAYFIEPTQQADSVIADCHCRQCFITGGPTWWFNINYHNGPLSFSKGNMMGGMYLNPWTSSPTYNQWVPYIQNQVLIDSTGISNPVGTQVQTNINGTRPRGTRWVENILGPQNNQNTNPTYPDALAGGNNNMVYVNFGCGVASDAQYLKGIQNQFNNIFNTDGITTVTNLNAGTAYSSITVTPGIPYTLQPYDVIFVVQPQSSTTGQSNSRMFVVGPNAVAQGSNTINVMDTEGNNTSTNQGTFPVINTTPTVTIASGANVYTPYSDAGKIMGWGFDWHGFDRMLSSYALVGGSKLVSGTSFVYVDALPGQINNSSGTPVTGTYPDGTSLPVYVPANGDTLTIQSSTPLAASSTTGPNSQTLTITGPATLVTSGTYAGTMAIPVSPALNFPYEKGAPVIFNNYSPTWRGNPISINQSVMNARFALMGMGPSDARTWIRCWGNYAQSDRVNQLTNKSKIGSSGYDAYGLYMGA